MDTNTIFQLRREGKLSEALAIATELYRTDPSNPWVQKALAWPLIDLCKKAIDNKNYYAAEDYFGKINEIVFTAADDVIDAQKIMLRPKAHRSYEDIRIADELSKSGKKKEALDYVQELKVTNALLEIHHEIYGWVIYRYINDGEIKKTIDVKHTRMLLRDYMVLKNERPSLLHSIMLQFALEFYSIHREFNLYKFFLMWSPENLTVQDVTDTFYDDNKRSPSLLSKIFKILVNTGIDIKLTDFIDKGIPLSNQNLLDIAREPYYWNIYNAGRNNNKELLWTLFENYNTVNKGYEASPLHSKILNMAIFVMVETNEYRFLKFFEDWGFSNFMPSDWLEVKKNEKTYKPLAIKAIKKAFDGIKLGNSFSSIDSLIVAYKTASEKYPDDNWLRREYALLLAKINQKDSAAYIYKILVLELGSQPYAWYEFSEFLAEGAVDIKIGMLAKAIKLQDDESYLGDIRLEIASQLLVVGLKEAAALELITYRQHRDRMGWKLAERYSILYTAIGSEKPIEKDNFELYGKYIMIAEDYVYSEFPWIEMVLADKWTDDKKKEILLFTNGSTLEFTVNSKKFELTKNAVAGDVLKFRIRTKNIMEKSRFSPPVFEYFPLVAQGTDVPPWSILPDTIAVADYINREKNIIHAITNNGIEVFFSNDNNSIAVGDYIKAKILVKKYKNEVKTELRAILKSIKEECIAFFQSYDAIVDSVNEQKQLFHYVVNKKIGGIIKFIDSTFKPAVGDIIKVVLVSKLDKKANRMFYKVLDISLSTEGSPLKKEISGLLKLKFKRGGLTLETSDLEFNEEKDFKPDFGFIDDYYVPKEVLLESKIFLDTNVSATAIFTGEKWKVISINKV